MLTIKSTPNGGHVVSYKMGRMLFTKYTHPVRSTPKRKLLDTLQVVNHATGIKTYSQVKSHVVA